MNPDPREQKDERERERRDGAPAAAEATGNGAEDLAEAEATEDGAAEQVKQDLDDLTAAKRERDEYLELAQRTRADFDNYRKRVAKDAAEALQRGRAALAREVVPVLDNLERALDAAESGEGAGALAKGVGLVRDELRSVLERAGVEAYDPAGERFDPSWHEAISTRAEEGTDSGTVVETLERGYRLDGEVLRPARVIVSE